MSTDLGKPIDFDVVREPWQRYELNDNTVVKSKLIITKIYKIAKNGKPSYTIDGQTVTVLLAPPESKGPPDNFRYSPQQLKEAVIQDDVKYITLAEEWHEYILDDGTKMRIKTTISGIKKTSKFDKDGEPIYLVNNNVLIQTKLPKTE